MSGKLAINGGAPVRTKPFPRWPVCDEKEAEAVREVALSGKWWMGAYSKGELEKRDKIEGRSKVEELEEKFAKHHKARYAVATSSGSSALEIAVRAAGIGPGDEVITTPYTFIATSTCILNNNAIPVYVDIDPETYNINADLIEEAITERTKAILPVHFSGNLADMDKICAIAEKHGLVVIEDASHAHGVERDGEKYAGTFGQMGCFSFQEAKNMAAGEGGMILTDDPELEDICYSLHHYGRVRDGLWYEHHRLGWNARMTEFQAAILLVQLERLDKLNRVRMENVKYLKSRLDSIPGIKYCKDDPRITKHSHHLFMMRYDSEEFDGVHRNKFVDALNAEGIPAITGYTFPNYANPFMVNKVFHSGSCPASCEKYSSVTIDYRVYKDKCPVAERACYEEAIWLEHRLFLGTKADMDDIVEAILKIRENLGELAR
ncbi:MAG: DegT/DnrJ/EryC1/StrS family aminotransferase [Firmicutes bacterium]|nr:DegT/DnrJ/EryC1/StrS family aminotransferase [Bacillota bacterium]